MSEADREGIKDIAIGSAVNIRHVNTQGGYLHSHAHNYPGGSNRTSSHVQLTSVVSSGGQLQNNRLRCIPTAILTTTGA